MEPQEKHQKPKGKKNSNKKRKERTINQRLSEAIPNFAAVFYSSECQTGAFWTGRKAQQAHSKRAVYNTYSNELEMKIHLAKTKHSQDSKKKKKKQLPTASTDLPHNKIIHLPESLTPSELYILGSESRDRS